MIKKVDKFSNEHLNSILSNSNPFFYYSRPDIKKWLDENSELNYKGKHVLKRKLKMKEPELINLREFPINLRKLLSLYSFLVKYLEVEPRKMSYDLLYEITKQYLEMSSKKSKQFTEALYQLLII